MEAEVIMNEDLDRPESLVINRSGPPPTPWDNWEKKLSFAAALVSTGFLPVSIKTPAQALAIILAGQEVGVDPMHALQTINVIQGRVTLSAQLMRALMVRGGVRLEWVEMSDTRAAVKATRRGVSTVVDYTFKEAEVAGLTGKGPWKQYARDMLVARCTSRTARLVAADLLGGMVYTPEELGAQVNQEGEILALPVTAEALPEAKVLADGSPFEVASWLAALNRATGSEAPVIWSQMLTTFAETFKKFAPEDQATLARAYAEAQTRV